MPAKRHVALLIESSRVYGRGLLRGVAKYIHLNQDWSIYQYERRLNDPAPRWLKHWKGDGVIARIEPSLVHQVKNLNVPIIDVTGVHHLDGIVMIDTNNAVVGQMAAEHLLDRGFDYFAFCGYPGLDYSDAREAAFVKCIEEAGHEVAVYRDPGDKVETKDIAVREAPGRLNGKHFMKWLNEQPRPLGLFACNDTRGLHLLGLCREYGVQVPEQVALIGVDNDEVLCELAYPSMTSVKVNAERIGYLGAELLDKMMDGYVPEEKRIEVDPIGVVGRKSTDLLAIDDEVVTEALRLIRDRLVNGVTVDDLVRVMNVSRSTLERRFAKALNRTPKTEILRMQIEHVKRLLLQTDLPLQRIAELVGFKYAEHLNMVFKNHVGKTPGEFRVEANLSN